MFLLWRVLVYWEKSINGGSLFNFKRRSKIKSGCATELPSLIQIFHITSIVIPCGDSHTILGHSHLQDLTCKQSSPLCRVYVSHQQWYYMPCTCFRWRDWSITRQCQGHDGGTMRGWREGGKWKEKGREEGEWGGKKIGGEGGKGGRGDWKDYLLAYRHTKPNLNSLAA